MSDEPKNVCKNNNRTCWNCPAAKLKGNVDFRACGQSKKIIDSHGGDQILIECSRRPELGRFEPNITFEQCPEWQITEYGYVLKKMKVMILGMDGYLGWTLALKLASLGFQVSGIDNFCRRSCVSEKGSQSVVPVLNMPDRLHAVQEKFGYNINFREIDIRDLKKMREFLEEEMPEAVVHYAEIPSAPYSMIDLDHSIKVQDNNVLGTLGLLWLMKDIVPTASLIKLGTMGEYGSPLTGRPIFEGIFPADAMLKWQNREWSLGGEITPRDPVSFYHVSKVQDTFNIYEACKYWWLRSYDVMQGIIYGVHTDQVSADPRLRTRLDIDEWFGTIINRFVAQVVLGMPLTIYGGGEQIRGCIALDDAMDCMVRLIISPPEPGQYDVVNQVSGLHKVKDVAEIVAKVAKDKYNIDVKIQRIENPRVETENHPFEVVSKKLPALNFKSRISLEKEVIRMFDLAFQPYIKKRIKEKAHLILPKTRWSGEKKDSEILEVYEPGRKDSKDNNGYQGILNK